MFNTVSIHSNHSDINKKMMFELIPKLKSIGLNPIKENGKLNIILGGDGTFLKAARKLRPDNNVLLGINTGNLGFFSEFNESNVDELVEMLRSEEYFFENVPAYQVKVNGDVEDKSLFFMNDLVLERKGTKVIHGIMYFDDIFFSDFVGDGIVISTPIGSTSYNLNAGGPVIYDLDNALQLTPLNPINSEKYQSLAHSVSFKPSSEFRWAEGEEKTRPARLVLDGKEFHFKDIHSVEVLPVVSYVRILRSKNYSKHRDFSRKILGLNI